MTRRTISLAGSTGSIGRQVIEVAEANPDLFEIVAIGANRSVDELARQAQKLRPKIVAVADDSSAYRLAAQIPDGVELRAGIDALASIASEADMTINAVVGFAGLPVTLTTLHAGCRLGLANKESLIAAGPLVHEAEKTVGAELVPIDSEHVALHQCLRSGTPREIRKLVVTASGGPFRTWTNEQLEAVTVEQALEHPTWKMGPKITIDSSTLFNKGLEVIEAHELFGVSYDDIQVVVHPQSLVHSAVEFTDGSTIAQLSTPDMRLPIGYAMGYPDRLGTPFGAIDLTMAGSLDFEEPDTGKFPCLELAYQAGRIGGTAPAWLNAANEVAVQGFFEGVVTWGDISSIIEETLQSHDGVPPSTLEAVVEADVTAREHATQAVKRKAI